MTRWAASGESWPPSKARIRALIEEAIVDAYDDEEQRTGILTMIEQQLALPFQTVILGVRVTVERIDLSRCFRATGPSGIRMMMPLRSAESGADIDHSDDWAFSAVTVVRQVTTMRVAMASSASSFRCSASVLVSRLPAVARAVAFATKDH